MRQPTSIARAARVVALFVALIAGGWALIAQSPAPDTLILVSLDGWRWDYLSRANAPHLKALAARGIRSEALIPSFPTLTFPNHYTIVTGLYPDHHGIVSNSIVDRTIGPDRFGMNTPTARDPRWWGGEPIWTTAIRQGRKSASMFWPGSEAVHPTYWKPFDDAFPNHDRVKQVLDWMALPEAERPAFITLYFSDVDTAAHRSGPDSDEALAAASRLDEMVGRLVAGLEQIGALARTTVVVVSDHGLAETSVNRLILLDDYVRREDVEVVDLSAGVSINPRATTDTETIYRQFAGRHPSLTVYRKTELPAALHYGSHPRVPAIVGLVQAGWTATWRETADKSKASGRTIGGAHGYPPDVRDMHGLFIAAGPQLREGLVVPPIENVHLYEFMCRVLGLKAAANDGDAAKTRTWIK